MREVQYTFPSVFNVFEHDAEIAPEVALDAQAAKFEKMDIFLHFEGDGNNDSDDEMVEMRRNFLDQVCILASIEMTPPRFGAFFLSLSAVGAGLSYRSQPMEMKKSLHKQPFALVLPTCWAC